MSGNRVPAATVLICAQAAGVGGELLLRVEPWGASAPGAALLFGLTVAWVVWRYELKVGGALRWLLVVLPASAALFAWRDSAALQLLGACAVLGSLAAAAVEARGGRVLETRLLPAALTAGSAAISTWVSPVAVLAQARNEGGRPEWWSGARGAAVRGAVLALPPLVVFGALLASADAAFARLVSEMVLVDSPEVVSHAVFALVLAWLTAGYLWWVTRQRGAVVIPSNVAGVAGPRVGATELSFVLGSLTLLFATFLAVQFRYLFGGEELVLSVTGLTYAEYARRGFFELTAVAMLLLPVLLLAGWLVRDDEHSTQRLYRALSGALIVLIAVMLGSAFYRMRLYQEAYGMTVLRFYTAAGMGWMAFVFFWFAATVLRARPERFTGGVVASVLVALFALAALDPEARIVAANAERARAGLPFDAVYARTLSADAVPQLIRSLPHLPEPERELIVSALAERWGPGARRHGAGDVRTWNASRARALRLVAQLPVPTPVREPSR